MIIDGQRKPDVFVSAGTIPIMKLMNNNNAGDNQQQQPLAQWLVKFASAEMVIAYSPSSKFHLDLDKAKKDRYHGIKFYHNQVSGLEEPIQN